MWRPAFNKQMLWSTADPRAVLFVHIAPGDAAPSWHIGLASVPQAGEEAEFSGRVICSCQFSSYGPRPSILLNTPVSTMQDLFPTFICSGGNFAVPCTADGLAYYASASGAFRTSWTPQAGVGEPATLVDGHVRLAHVCVAHVCLALVPMDCPMR